MAVNKVVLGDETLLDLTEDTATAEDVVSGKSFHLASGVRSTGTALYAGSNEAGGNATATNGILFGQVDSTSTATVFTATVPGVTEYYDGLTIMLKNGVVTSTTNFTININGLGAKPSYTNLAAATRDTTIFNVNYTMLFIYDSTRVSGGCWICFRGYDANTNTIGYQLRTNSTVMNVSDTARYYKLYFTSADGTMWVPASVNSTNNATSARPVNQRPINPFGRIVYTSASTSYAAGASLAATTIWDQYTLSLGYSFNRSGAALNLTLEAPVYVRCAPQADGSAIMDADTPIVQTIPTTEDGKIYIYLGIAYSATAIELVPHHPVYYYKDGALRLWTGAEPASGSDANARSWYGTCSTAASTTAKVVTCEGFELVDGASITVRFAYYGSVDGPITLNVNGTGAKTVYIDGSATNSKNTYWFGRLMTFIYNGTGWYLTSELIANYTTLSGKISANDVYGMPTASSTAPIMDGTAAVGTSSNYARADHVHPTDLPSVTSSDNGKVLMVVNGAWAAGSIPSANGVSF